MFISLSNNAAAENDVETLAELVNRYGFMAIFSVIMLSLIAICIISFSKRNNRKQDSELKILCEEREASIEQNKQMFELVTKVQTEQVVQLQQMTSLLREMNRSVNETEVKLSEANDNFEKLRESILLCDDHSKHIITTLSEILDYVKTSQICNNEILTKVNSLEECLIKKHND